MVTMRGTSSLAIFAAGVAIAVAGAPLSAFAAQDNFPCGTYYPKAFFYKPWTWKYYPYAKYGYYTGDCNAPDTCIPDLGGLSFENTGTVTLLDNSTTTTDLAKSPLGLAYTTQQVNKYTFVLQPLSADPCRATYLCSVDPIKGDVGACVPGATTNATMCGADPGTLHFSLDVNTKIVKKKVHVHGIIQEKKTKECTLEDIAFQGRGRMGGISTGSLLRVSSPATTTTSATPNTTTTTTNATMSTTSTTNATMSTTSTTNATMSTTTTNAMSTTTTTTTTM